MLPAPAQAHGVSPAISGFYAGGLIFLAGPQDILQWVALCALAATHRPDRAGWVAEALTAGLLAGFAAGMAGWAAPPPMWISEAGLLAVGVLLVAGIRLPFIVAVGLSATIGALHGAHDGLDLVTRPDGLAVAAGLAITAYTLMVTGIAALVWLLPRIAPVRAVALRAFGSWVVAIAMMLGAVALLHR